VKFFTQQNGKIQKKKRRAEAEAEAENFIFNPSLLLLFFSSIPNQRD